MITFSVPSRLLHASDSMIILNAILHMSISCLQTYLNMREKSLNVPSNSQIPWRHAKEILNMSKRWTTLIPSKLVKVDGEIVMGTKSGNTRGKILGKLGRKKIEKLE